MTGEQIASCWHSTWRTRHEVLLEVYGQHVLFHQLVPAANASVFSEFLGRMVLPDVAEMGLDWITVVQQ